MQIPSKTNWGAVFIALTAGILAAAHYGKAPSALPGIRAEIPLSLIVGGWIMSVFSATGSVLSVATGSLTDRIGGRRFCLLGLAALSIGALIGGVAGSGEWLLFSRFIEGLGFVSVAVSAPILIMRASTPANRQMALGFWTTYMPTGMALSILISPYLLSVFSWRTVWFGASALSLIWIVVILLTFDKDERVTTDKPEKPPAFWSNLGRSIKNPGAWILSMCFGCYTIQWISIMAWLPSFLVQERGIDLKTVGFLVAAIVAINIPGNLASSLLINRGMARSTTLLIAAIGMGVTVYMIFDQTLGDGWRFAACLGFSCFGGMLPGTVLSSVPVVAPSSSHIGTVNGMIIQGSHIGQMIGPPMIAAIVTATGNWGDARWLLIAASLGVASLSILFRRMEMKLS